jgi:hypothetical protein
MTRFFARAFPLLGLFLIGVLVGAAAVTGATRGGVSSSQEDLRVLKAEVEQLRAAARAVIPIEPGEGDNAPPDSVWKGQTGRIRYLAASTKGFDYIVEIENMPPNQTWHNFFAIAPTGKNPLENIKKAGEIKTDAFGRGTLSGLIPLPAGQYILGHFLSNKDDPNPPFTHRTYLCIRTSASFEVLPPR